MKAKDGAKRSLKAGLAFADTASRRGPAVADKSVMISNLPHVAQHLAQEYREAGYPVTAARSTEMLGVRSQPQPDGNLSTSRARWQKFRNRVDRISYLSNPAIFDVGGTLVWGQHMRFRKFVSNALQWHRKHVGPCQATPNTL